MAELAAITKSMDFHLEQVQDFTPTPMTVSTETWYTGFDPYTLEPIESAKTQREKLAQRMFFFWYKPEERNNIERELRRIGRQDLIAKLYNSPRNSTSPSKGPHPTPSHKPEKPGKRKSFNPNFDTNNKPKRGKRRGDKPLH